MLSLVVPGIYCSHKGGFATVGMFWFYFFLCEARCESKGIRPVLLSLNDVEITYMHTIYCSRRLELRIIWLPYDHIPDITKVMKIIK